MKFPEMVSLELAMEVIPVTRIVEVQSFTAVALDEARIRVNLTGAEELP